MMKPGQLLTLLTLLLPLLFLGCQEATGGFEEYAGVNLLEWDSGIAVHDFASGDWTDAATDANYLVFTPGILPPDTTGLPAAAVDYSSLEIPNLAANGDFETGGTGNWTTGGGNSFSADNTGQIDGTYSLNFYTLNDPTSMVQFDLASGLLDGFVNNSSYYFHFDFLGINVNLFEVNGGALDSEYFSPAWMNSNNSGSYSPYSLCDVTGDNLVTDNGAVTPYFSIGTQNASLQQGQQGYLDNLQVVRADVDKWIYIDVPLQETGRLPLVSGTYEFSCYVRIDTNRTTPTVPNTFAPSAVSLRIEDLTPYPNSNSWVSSPADSSWTTSWQRISIQTDLIDIEPSVQPLDNVLRLAITPTDFFNQESGLLLIAYPELKLVP